VADVVVVGAGIAGLGTALALSRSGHAVTVVERDATSVPESPDATFEQWERKGAPQVRHSHAFLARLRNLLRDRAPDVLDHFLEAGASEVPLAEDPPPTLEDKDPRPGDEDLVALACRRTTFEWVLRRDVLDATGVRLVQGAVDRLVTGPSLLVGVPDVVGVGLAGGGELRGDLVVDASGVRSPLPEWLSAAGARPVPERKQDTGIIYSSRFYRLCPGAELPPPEGVTLGDLGYLKFAVFNGDNRTFSVTFGLSTDDRELRLLLRPGPFTTAAAAIPGIRPWLEPGRSTPITGVEIMGRLFNRRRRLVVGQRPLATGLVAVGDSAICTNPLYGRGCSLAMVHAYLLADTLVDHPDDPVAASLAFAEATRREIEPWYVAAVAQDHHARPEASVPLDDKEGALPFDAESIRSLVRDGLLPAARTDPVVFRAFLRSFNLLDPPTAIMENPDVVARVLRAWQERDNRPSPPPFGPDRDEMLRILAGGAAA
jgi:2-polyprenyl-6-methoxyphenol hydroxylase-like FAD-dependent oxidoreductase